MFNFLKRKKIKEKRDPIEKTKKFKKIEKEVNQKARNMVGKEFGTFGSCHRYWKLKKEILKNEYGIDWKTPAEMNPHIHYD